MTQTPNIRTTSFVTPQIYAYTTPGIPYHEGWTKVGYTEGDVKKRIQQQCHTAGIKWSIEWCEHAVFEDDGSSFTDHDFHCYLRKNDYENNPGTEWFRISGEKSHAEFFEFRANHGIIDLVDLTTPYKLRAEQEDAVAMTADYASSHQGGEFLWNAKPRFGKTLSVYDFCKRIGARTVLIVTNRPAVANSWYDDYMRFMGTDSGYWFVSEVDALKGRKGVLTRDEYTHVIHDQDRDRKNCIEFVSLQDLKGSIYFGGQFDKLAEISDQRGITWDVLVIDEAHEGVDTIKTDVAFDHINRKFTLHLSGTPFKALANNKFQDDAIYNWTYADEQQAKRDWDETSEEENPYASLPMLSLYTYQMSEIIRDELSQGIEIDGETEEYAFDLNEFFATDERGAFVHGSSVDKFLDAMVCQKRFPFSTPELRNELKHTFWLLNRVSSAKALAKKLAAHPVFGEYEIVLAAGDGKLDDQEATEKSFDKVRKAIAENEKTITLSVGQLTTGVTIPEWTAVMMLSNVKSPSLYMQAAFRAQNPYLFDDGEHQLRKENAYVFDFDPARTLIIFEEFANDLCAKTAGGSGTAEDRKRNVAQLLNFFPVIGEDEGGELVELDAEKVLTIPRKIKSQEVVRRGFMSNFLFQNISNIFSAPQAVIDIIENFTPVAEPSRREIEITPSTAGDLSIDENGDIALDDEYVIGRASDVFGSKIYGPSEKVQEAFEYAMTTLGEGQRPAERAMDALKTLVRENAVSNIMEAVDAAYGEEMRKSDRKTVEAQVSEQADRMVEKQYREFQIDYAVIESERKRELNNRFDSGRSVQEINEEFDQRQQKAQDSFADSFNAALDRLVDETRHETIRTVETKQKEREKSSIEDGIRDHLRGFSRTIPSFLMAYGDGDITLANFDQVIPADVFAEVTSITLDEFRFLRDGGDYVDDSTGESKHFDGQLFNEIVFDDSIREFMSLRRRLANYFDDSATEDIFDYVPPQKTNQIFTPKAVVKQMVDLLEQENPGCFDNPDNTFIDLYMKSGLYVAEIVKRLYRSDAMKTLYPDGNERLQHIFAKQVYGLAPTKIIMHIAMNFVLGFSEDVDIEVCNLRHFDALPAAKAGTLSRELDKLFG